MQDIAIIDPATQRSIAPAFVKTSRFARISVYQLDNIVITQFSGPCGQRLVADYAKALKQLVARYGHLPWAYLSVSMGFEAATQGAITELARSYRSCQILGCKADAFVIGSAVGREQIRQLRERFNTPYAFDEVLFDDWQAALSFLKGALAQHKQ